MTRADGGMLGTLERIRPFVRYIDRLIAFLVFNVDVAIQRDRYCLMIHSIWFHAVQFCDDFCINLFVTGALVLPYLMCTQFYSLHSFVARYFTSTDKLFWDVLYG